MPTLNEGERISYDSGFKAGVESVRQVVADLLPVLGHLYDGGSLNPDYPKGMMAAWTRANEFEAGS